MSFDSKHIQQSFHSNNFHITTCPLQSRFYAGNLSYLEQVQYLQLGYLFQSSTELIEADSSVPLWAVKEHEGVLWSHKTHSVRTRSEVSCGHTKHTALEHVARCPVVTQNTQR